jgi:hypothetical protein
MKLVLFPSVNFKAIKKSAQAGLAWSTRSAHDPGQSREGNQNCDCFASLLKIKKSAQAGLADFSISSDQSNFDHQVGYTGFEPVTSTLSR